MGLNTREITERHIRILELRGEGKKPAEIIRIMRLTPENGYPNGLATVYNTLNNHRNGLDRLREKLKRMEGARDEVKQLSLEHQNNGLDHSGEESESAEEGDVVAVAEVAQRTDLQNVSIFHTLLEIILEEGYDTSKVWSNRMQAKLGFLAPEEVDAYLSGLEEVDVGNGKNVAFVEKMPQEDGSFIYRVTDAGEPYAKYELLLGVQHEENTVEDGKESLEDMGDVEDADNENNVTNVGLEADDGGRKDVSVESVEAVPEIIGGVYGTGARILEFMEGPGSLRIMSSTFEKLERRLRISPAEREEAIKEMLRRGLIENNDRGAYVATGQGKAFLATVGDQVEQRQGLDAAELR